MTYTNYDLFLSYILVFVQVKDVPLILFCILLTKVDGEDDFELKIESIIEGCNDIATNQERIYEHQSFPLKTEKLSEAIFTTQNPCQVIHSIYLLVFTFEFFMTKLNLKNVSLCYHISYIYNRFMIVVCNCGSLKQTPSVCFVINSLF